MKVIAAVSERSSAPGGQQSEAAGSHHPTLTLSHEGIGIMDAGEKLS
jgi:hypothetical protein